MPWGEYRTIVRRTTDSEKFDDMLKMVIASDETSLLRFQNFLEEAYHKGELVYGLHTSDSSIMTCLVFERNGSQVHFVDSTNGGYPMAAKAFKERESRIRH